MDTPEDDDMLDGCAVEIEPDDDATAALRALFPDGDASTAPEWQQLADSGALEQRRGP